MSDWILYIDPGSGSYLVQLLVAAALGVAFFFRNIKNSIKAFFTKKPKEPTDNTKT
jgi:hypothetical protein